MEGAFLSWARLRRWLGPRRQIWFVLLRQKCKRMSLKVVKSLGVGRFLDWGAVDAKGSVRS